MAINFPTMGQAPSCPSCGDRLWASQLPFSYRVECPQGCVSGPAEATPTQAWTAYRKQSSPVCPKEGSEK